MSPEPAASRRGRLVALEGIDGCGKSTQASLLAEHLAAMCTFEPGATALGVLLRQLLLGGDAPAPVARAEALLMVADRAQHLAEVIEPALSQGRWVVTDRFSGSTLAYQGWGRGLEIEGLRQVESWGCGGLRADLTVLVDVPVAVARARLEGCGADRLEGLDPAFHQRVRDGFLALAGGDPARWAVVQGTGSVQEVAFAVREVVHQRLGQR